MESVAEPSLWYSDCPKSRAKIRQEFRTRIGETYSRIELECFSEAIRMESSISTKDLKVIVANPTMIKAYKAGIPGNGQPFPDGSMIVKLQWKPKKSTEAPFAVEVPDVFKQAFVIEKDSKRFPENGGWGYAVFNYDAASDKFTADQNSLSNCGNACHTAVKAKDYIFHPYQKR
jgi:hypothetical protein